MWAEVLAFLASVAAGFALMTLTVSRPANQIVGRFGHVFSELVQFAMFGGLVFAVGVAVDQALDVGTRDAAIMTGLVAGAGLLVAILVRVFVPGWAASRASSNRPATSVRPR